LNASAWSLAEVPQKDLPRSIRVLESDLLDDPKAVVAEMGLRLRDHETPEKVVICRWPQNSEARWGGTGAGRGQAQWRKDVLGQECRVGLSAGCLHDLAEQDVPGAAVGPGAARCCAQRRLLDHGQQVAGSGGPQRIDERNRVPVSDARGVRQQVMDGHGPPGRRATGQPPLDRVVEPESAAFGEQEDRRGSELLADRGDLKPGLRRAQCTGLPVGYPTDHKIHPNMLRDVNRWIMGGVTTEAGVLADCLAGLAEGRSQQSAGSNSIGTNP
jgi:hypothetical protein